MARPLRVHIPGALYHVMSRGNARQEIFLGPEDYEHFLERLSITTARFLVRCRAYCLMRNHFHLLLEPNQFSLSRMMQQLNSSYSQWFNRRHGRVGHVLQGRFKALLIDRDDYFRRVLRYIALNPVRARVVRHPAEWPWSSHCATAGLVAPVDVLALDDVWNAFDPVDHRRAQQLYADFVGTDAADLGDVPSGPLVCGSGTFAARVGVTLAVHRHTRDIVYAERFAVRPPLDRLMTNTHDSQARDIVMREAFERYGYTLREIGDFVGRHPSTVWRRIRRAARPAFCGELQTEKIEI
jgi:REP element-mobilizing transposase RayT